MHKSKSVSNFIYSPDLNPIEYFGRNFEEEITKTGVFGKITCFGRI